MIVTLTEDALVALAHIAERRASKPKNDREIADNREQVRSYAVDVVNALLRGNERLRQLPVLRGAEPLEVDQ